MKHTPTPWYLIVKENGWGITSDKQDIIPANWHEPNTEANTQFILQACNAYTDMLEALHLCVDWFEGCQVKGRKTAKGAAQAAAESARDAISKAEG